MYSIKNIQTTIHRKTYIDTGIIPVTYKAIYSYNILAILPYLDTANKIYFNNFECRNKRKKRRIGWPKEA